MYRHKNMATTQVAEAEKKQKKKLHKHTAERGQGCVCVCVCGWQQRAHTKVLNAERQMELDEKNTV